MTTPEQRLRQAVEDYAAAPEIAREKRNEAIRAAAAAGLKQVDIIRITHYSRETVRRALDPDVAARVKAAREAADAERAASAVTKPHPWPRGAVVVALDNREGTFTPSAPDDTHIKARVGTIKTGLYLGLKHKAKARLGEDASVEAIMRDVYEQAVRAGIL